MRSRRQPEWYSRLNVVEARVGVAQAQRKVAQDLLRQAEAEAVAAAAEREYRWDQHDRIVQFEKTMPSGVERRLIDEEEERYRLAQAAERVAELKTIVSRASLDAVTAAVREAQAQRDITRAQEARSNAAAGAAPDADSENDLKAARARLRKARLDRARSERQAASAEVDRAEADQKKAKATVELLTRVVERLRQLVARQAIPQRSVDEQEQALSEARNAERDAEAAIGLARAQLKAAGARLKAADGEVRTIDHPPVFPPRLAPR